MPGYPNNSRHTLILTLCPLRVIVDFIIVCQGNDRK